jgi:predicted AAA+ superfamily ATPase
MPGVLRRAGYLSLVRRALARSPIVSLIGPRGSGKTALARAAASGRKATFFDLESSADFARLWAPMYALEPLRGLVVIDEIQRAPGLLESLSVLADRPGKPARFLILGNTEPRLVQGVSEILAGQVRAVDMAGFDLTEVGVEHFVRLWIRGGFPSSFSSKSDKASFGWRCDYVREFLQRDLRELGLSIPVPTLGRFLQMLAHFHGGVWNSAEFARALGTSENTARRYLDVLSGTGAVRQLLPWRENLSKRQVRAPKIYVRDTGLLLALLEIETHHELMGHPKAGASWEGFVIEQILTLLRSRDAYFWSTYQGAELDLMVMHGGKRYGFDVQLSDAPVATKSMRIALQDLKLERLFVVYPGRQSYPLEERLESLSIVDLPTRLAALS